ncbi:tetratricopeptide repeat protein [Colwellia piezophila]|uniref:tetratricopeptide repeat protein n=1 Tax=Colwellia piezophila TaxID=211668 RepID=UPI00036DC0AD|nr:tetratricopeptide repeat protein [Colwellia piezophila]
MSVINQMLKDLEQRTPESDANVSQTSNITVSQSPMKIVVLTTVSVLLVCFVCFYIWQLKSENNALKSLEINEQAATEKYKSIGVSEIKVKVNGGYEPESTNRVKGSSQQSDSTGHLPGHLPSHLPRNGQNQQALPIVNTSANVKSSIINAPIIKEKSSAGYAASQVTPAKKMAVIANHGSSHQGDINEKTHGHPHTPPEFTQVKTAKLKLKPLEAKLKAKVTTNSTPKANTMSVSRRQLSADELVQQKLVLVEKALAAKEVSQAEALLEDVLIIKPNDSQARKKLAALWFGRQAYQDATNLLSQGIAINSKDSSLREMKARIHLRQGQVMAALNTLKPLADLKNQQYQIMLANTAQQAQQNETAVKAYEVLIAMQPSVGRWQLALAILYDKNSQFNLASKAYQQALAKNDLSVSSAAFAQQRLQAIGQ